MITSVYIKDNNIHFYNEDCSFINIGGVAYELGKPLLDFVWYDPEQFKEGFSMIAEAFDDEYAHIGVKQPEFIVEITEMMRELQKREIYVYFYYQMFIDFIFTFIESPQEAIEKLSKKLPTAGKKLSWAVDFE